MSGRKNALQSHGQSPERYRFEWDSDSKQFRYYDVENPKKEGTYDIKERKLPFKFVILQKLYRVQGFNQTLGKGIFSDEIVDFDQELTVRYNKGGEVAKGVWKDIKETVISKGGKMNIVVIALLSNGEVAKITMKAKAFFNIGEYIKKASEEVLYDHFCIVNKFTSEVNGNTKYTVPVFEVGDKISEELSETADSKYDLEVQPYIATKSNPAAVTDQQPTPDQNGSTPNSGQPEPEGAPDDLPF